MTKPLLLLITTLLLASCLGAQATVILNGYNTRLWQTQDGLPDQIGQAFTQTNDGNLWIGTKGSLLKFDGATFTSYTRENGSASLERGVNSLLASRDGDLWIGTEGGGLIRYHNRRFLEYPTSDGLSNSFVRAIYEDHAGTIWVGADQGLFKVSGNGLTRVDGTGGVPSLFVRAIVEDHKGNLWVGGTELLQFCGGSFTRAYPLDTAATGGVITTMATAHDGTVWIGTWLSLLQSSNLETAPPVKVPGFSAQVSALREGKDGSIWIGAVGQGLYLYRQQHLLHLPTTDLPSQTVQAILEDREENIWLGTRAGILRLSKTPVSIVPFPQGADSEFETIYRDTDGTIWVAASTHLFRIRKGMAKPFPIPHSHGMRIRTLLRDRDNRLWIGTDGAGLICLSGQRERTYDNTHGLINNFVRALLQSDDGSIWVGTDGGLTRIGPHATQSFDTSNGLTYFSVTSLLEDRDKAVWVGTSRGISHIVNGKIIRDAVTDQLRNEQIWSIDQDPRGELWFGTSSGLYGYNQGKVVHLTTRDGLASDIVGQILRDTKGNIWLSGPNNVSRLSVAQLDDVAEGKRSHVYLNLYLNSYDMESASLYNGMQPSGIIATNGDVWYPSNKGAVHIAADQAIPQAAAPVVINEVVADGQQVSVRGPITLEPGNERLEISYGAVRLRSQQGLRYRYRLDGFEPWNEALTRRTAYYTQLSPGTYRFRVQAFDVDHSIVISEASIQFTQKPHFYSTWWFWTICAATLLAAILLIYRMRLVQMKLRFEAVSDERARLAREMHDTVIQSCVGVLTLLEAALEVDVAEEALRHQLLSYANEQVRTTIEEARDAVWDLRSRSESTTDAGSLCQKIAREFASSSSLPIDCHISGNRYELDETATHELMMIFREALSNAIVHASPGRIEAGVHFQQSLIRIEVQDNGCGFDSHTTAPPGKHYGLLGMQERAELLGGHVLIDSSPGRGTRVEIIIPKRTREHEKMTAGGRHNEFQ